MQVEAVFKGNDVFIFLPTGYGKSCIYALLPSTFEIFFLHFMCLASHQYNSGTSGSIVVCVSLLTALMMDQVNKYTSIEDQPRLV